MLLQLIFSPWKAWKVLIYDHVHALLCMSKPFLIFLSTWSHHLVRKFSLLIMVLLRPRSGLILSTIWAPSFSFLSSSLHHCFSLFLLLSSAGGWVQEQSAQNGTEVTEGWRDEESEGRRRGGLCALMGGKHFKQGFVCLSVRRKDMLTSDGNKKLDDLNIPSAPNIHKWHQISLFPRNAAICNMATAIYTVEFNPWKFGLYTTGVISCEYSEVGQSVFCFFFTYLVEMVSGLNLLQCQCWGETSSFDTGVLLHRVKGHLLHYSMSSYTFSLKLTGH